MSMTRSGQSNFVMAPGPCMVPRLPLGELSLWNMTNCPTSKALDKSGSVASLSRSLAAVSCRCCWYASTTSGE
eukprot:10830125-Alexandrium_andersonii.AAC.1